MSEIRNTFVGHCMELLRKEGMNQEDIENCLRSCWDHGVSTALYLPWIAFDEVSQGRRESFARYVLETLALDDYQAGQGEAPSDEELADLVKTLFAIERVLPGTVVSAKEGWIIGIRSNN